MRRIMTTPNNDSEVNDQHHLTKTHRPGRPGGDSPDTDLKEWSTIKDLHDQVMQLLSTKLSPLNIKQCTAKLELLKKCSFYLEVVPREMLLTPDTQQRQTHLHPTLLHLIDHRKFQRMKNLGHSQVSVQLSLLEALHEQLCGAKVEMETIFSQSDYGDREVDHVKLRISEVTEAFADFEKALIPGLLHTKHRLLTEMDSIKMPLIHLRLSVKMPVMFNKSRSEALTNCARLHWEIAGGEKLRPGEHFEIHYKLLQPANAEEGNQMGMVTRESCHVQVNNLLPQKRYEFTVKRADTASLVYGFWNDTVVLRTMAVSPGRFTGSREKRRRLFRWY